MTEGQADQTRQDPTEVHDQPDTEGEQLPAPGDEHSVTREMGDRPDHGEETYVGHDRLLVEEAGRRAVLVPTDLVEEAACQALVDRAVDELGRIDVLVNNAAYQMAQPGGIADITTEQLDRVMRTNVYAMFWLCKMALPHMRAGSTIINTSSVQSS